MDRTLYDEYNQAYTSGAYGEMLDEISRAYENGYRQGKFEARQEQNSEWGKTALRIVEKIDRYATLDIAATKWVPCSERLPDEEGYYLVTLGNENFPDRDVEIVAIMDGDWDWNPVEEILAWRKLPEPYKGDEE